MRCGPGGRCGWHRSDARGSGGGDLAIGWNGANGVQVALRQRVADHGGGRPGRVRDALQHRQSQGEETGVGRGDRQGVQALTRHTGFQVEYPQLLALEPGKGLLAQRANLGLEPGAKVGLRVGCTSPMTMQSKSRRRM